MSVRVTVAVATCGRPKSLAHCLEAIASQSRVPEQIIVVDQQPSTAVRDVIESCGLAVDYFEQARLGLSASRNLALERAHSTVLAVTDDDCFPDADWIAALYRAFDLEPIAAVTGPIVAPAGEAPAGMCALSLRLSQSPRRFTARAIPWHVGTGANFAGQVDALREIGGWDERLGAGTRGRAAEDCDVIDRLLADGKSILYEPRAVVRHDWQPIQRRGATRWSYGYGIGAMCGMRVAKNDRFGWSMMASYLRRHAIMLLKGARRLDGDEMRQRTAALAGVVPGFMYGLRAPSERSIEG